MIVKIGKLNYTNGDDNFMLEDLEINLDLQLMKELQKTGVEALKDIMSTKPKPVTEPEPVVKKHPKSKKLKSKVLTQEELDDAMKVVLKKRYPERNIYENFDKIKRSSIYNRYKHKAYCRAWNKKYAK